MYNNSLIKSKSNSTSLANTSYTVASHCINGINVHVRMCFVHAKHCYYVYMSSPLMAAVLSLSSEPLCNTPTSCVRSEIRNVWCQQIKSLVTSNATLCPSQASAGLVNYPTINSSITLIENEMWNWSCSTQGPIDTPEAKIDIRYSTHSNQH